MPIVFEQPSPLAPGITAGAGAAQQYSKDLPSLVGLYEALLRARGASGGGGGGHGGPGAEFGPTPQRFHMPEAGGGGGGGHSSGEPLSQAQQIRMAQLQAAEASVDYDSSLGDEEKQQYKMMIRAGLDPLKQKAAQYRNEILKQQKQQAMDQNAFMAAMQNTDEGERAKAIGQRIVRDPKTGDTLGFIDHKGDLKMMPSHELKLKHQALMEQREKRLQERSAQLADNRVKRAQEARKEAAAELKAEKPLEPADPAKIEERAKQIQRNWDRIEGKSPVGYTPGYWDAQGFHQTGPPITTSDDEEADQPTPQPSAPSGGSRGTPAPVPSVQEAAQRIWRGSNFQDEEDTSPDDAEE